MIHSPTVKRRLKRPLAWILAASILSVAGNANWSRPPRFDGAGYAVLARALATGWGFRAIDHPDHPLYAHFPPAYPAALALCWKATGISAVSAHVFSAGCTIMAVVAAWLWFRRAYAPSTALALALALAINWQWGRMGSAILSEPLYLLLAQAAILARQTRFRSPALLAACTLTRYVGVTLVAATVLEPVRKPRGVTIARTLGLVILMLAPWAFYAAWVGYAAGSTRPAAPAQALLSMSAGLLSRLIFYVDRIPDAILGPFVEVAQGRGRWFVIGSHVCAGIATVVVVYGLRAGWRRADGRIAGLVLASTLPLLVAWPYTEAGRFLVPLVPFLLRGALEGLAAIVRLGSRSWSKRMRIAQARQVAAWILLAGSIPYSAYQIGSGKTRVVAEEDREFERACTWLREQAHRPGPVISRHPGDVYWRTRREGLEVETAERPGNRDADPPAIDALIARYHVAYILVDESPYQSAHRSPLEEYVSARAGRLRLVWLAVSRRYRLHIYEFID